MDTWNNILSLINALKYADEHGDEETFSRICSVLPDELKIRYDSKMNLVFTIELPST